MPRSADRRVDRATRNKASGNNRYDDSSFSHRPDEHFRGAEAEYPPGANALVKEFIPRTHATTRDGAPAAYRTQTSARHRRILVFDIPVITGQVLVTPGFGPRR